MSSLPRRADAELLLEHASWMRKLARALVGDAERAEDLSQETWVRALEHPPGADRPLRGWLATVMRNLWRQSQRGEAHRGERERGAARAEAQASSADLVERVSTQRELVAAVLELEEPYRTTILMRYFEELSPQRIAARERIPVATVKTRLARGLERLRARLDREHGGDGRTWCLALLPVAARPEGASLLPIPAALRHALVSTFSIGAIAMNAKLVLSLVLLAAAGGWFLYSSTRSASAPPHPAALAAAAAPGAAELQPTAEREQPDPPAVPAAETKRELVAATRTSEVAPAAALPAVLFHGRVIDVDGDPIAGVDVVEGGEAERERGSLASSGTPDAPATAEAPLVASSAADGSFAWSPAAGSRSLAVRDRSWETVLASSARDGATIVVGPRISVIGTVVDEFGGALSAELDYRLPDGLRGRSGAVLDHSLELSWSTRADVAGAFTLERLPFVADATLVARAEGYVAASEPVPANGGRVVLVLRRPPLEGSMLVGEVVDATGRPVAEARVALGIDTAVTGADGRFAFDLSAEQSFNRMAAEFLEFTADRLIAVARGFAPAEYAPATDDAGRPLWPDHVVLRLGGPTLAIAGRVLGPDDEPVAGARVWIGDPTFFGGLGDPLRDDFPRITHVEAETVGAEPGWRWQETDAQGRFRIEGLMEREYSLEAMLPETLLRVVASGVRAGREGVELRFASDAAYAVLRGRVVDQVGNPVPDVAVAPMCDAFRTVLQGQVIQTQHQALEPVLTDAEGRFTLHDVPTDLVYLRLDAEDTVPLEWGRHVPGGLRALVADEPERVTIEVLRRCHFQVELSDPEEADELMILGLDGEPLEISEFVANGRHESPTHAIVGGRSSVLAVGDRAAWLVLLKEGRTLRQVEVRLVPGETTVLRP